MAKSGIQAISPEETFKRMFLPQGAPEETPTEPSPNTPALTPTEAITSGPAKLPGSPSDASESSITQGPAPDTAHSAGKPTPPKGVKLYLSIELDEALARRCYLDRSKNRSAHVRAALEEYLKEDLEAIRAGKP